MSVFYPEAITLPWDETLVSWAEKVDEKGGDEFEYVFPDFICVEVTTIEIENSCGFECENDCRRCACNDGYTEEIVEVYSGASQTAVYFRRTRMYQLGSCWSNWYYEGERIVNLCFKTAWANFHLEEVNGRFFESHCGYSTGCIWTEREELFLKENETLVDIKRKYIGFYGKYGE